MEMLPLKLQMFSIHGNFPMKWHETNCFLEELENQRVSFRPKRQKMQIVHSRIIPHYSKAFDFQDFQGFSKPLRLLPASEVTICTESSLEEELRNYVRDYGSDSFYLVQLSTSSDFGSSLSNLNAAILLCLINETGDSILQRIPATSSVNPRHLKEPDVAGELRFQRASVDKITFIGPNLSKIEAIWIGLESGSWRLGDISLIVLSRSDFSASPVDEKLNKYVGLQYDFEISNILVGESGGVSVVELRPHRVSELLNMDFSTLSNITLAQPPSPKNMKISAEQGMKEYADLKLSLLVYDAMLIFTGTSITAFSTNDESASAFLVGGLCGFFYLLFLQKSIDGLSVPTAIAVNSKREDAIQVFGGLKGPVLSMAFMLVLSVTALKYGLGAIPVVLTPRELLVGVAGFLTCKMAVVLAAFKPMVSTGGKENN